MHAHYSIISMCILLNLFCAYFTCIVSHTKFTHKKIYDIDVNKGRRRRK